jgi:hypothetical protein
MMKVIVMSLMASASPAEDSLAAALWPGGDRKRAISCPDGIALTQLLGREAHPVDSRQISGQSAPSEELMAARGALWNSSRSRPLWSSRGTITVRPEVRSKVLA